MGLLASSSHFIRYSVEGDPPADFWNVAADCIASHSFRDIDDTYEELSIGWVAVDNMFDAEFAGASFAVGDYLVLGLRVDERKVAPAMLKKFCMKEEERIKKERQLPRLSRGQKTELKENVRLALMKKTLPVAKVYDLAWNLAEGSLLFFSTNDKAQEILENFFKETFGLTLIRQIPFNIAGKLLDDARDDSLAALQPDIFI